MGALVADGKAFEEDAAGMEAIGLQFAHEFAMGCGVKLPEETAAPGAHGGRVDGADIGVGEQREKFEPFHCAGASCHGADDQRIREVARIHGGGHFQMRANEEEDGFPILGVDAEAFERRHREQGAGFRVALRLVSLAGVMEEESHQDKAEVGMFAGEFGKGRALLIAQGEEVFRGDERMFINGVLMVKIADDQRFNSRQFGKLGDK